MFAPSPILSPSGGEGMIIPLLVRGMKIPLLVRGMIIPLPMR